MRGRGHGGRPRHPCGVPVAIVAKKEGRGGCAGGGHGRRPRHPRGVPSRLSRRSRETLRHWWCAALVGTLRGPQCGRESHSYRSNNRQHPTTHLPTRTKCSYTRRKQENMRHKDTRCERGGEGTNTTCGGTSSTPLTRNERRDRLLQTERLTGGSPGPGRRDEPQSPRRRAAKGLTPRVEVPRRPRSRRTSSEIDCSKQND